MPFDFANLSKLGVFHLEEIPVTFCVNIDTVKPVLSTLSITTNLEKPLKI